MGKIYVIRIRLRSRLCRRHQAIAKRKEASDVASGRVSLIVAIAAPFFTYFGLKKEIKLAEQILAILGVVFTIELFIFLSPYFFKCFLGD